MPLRTATPTDVPALTTLINDAYVVERFFKKGDRITEDGVRALQGKGAFLLLEEDDGLRGAVYVELRGASATSGCCPSTRGTSAGDSVACS